MFKIGDRVKYNNNRWIAYGHIYKIERGKKIKEVPRFMTNRYYIKWDNNFFAKETFFKSYELLPVTEPNDILKGLL